MSYQVLARKWRPRFFREMVGQEHVLQALINALDNNRLHHAYLFTGTRGVGKTTIARILAKCLNCEVGVSSEPCGSCSACQEIAQGSFVDLIEIDAASYTGVDNMREIIDNAQYRPTKGRYKVYIIDEVHMLSKNAFNALLKTLEEPPEHVKFLLATTDPQKLPPTILSRCLQFNLKNMSPEKIAGHLQYVLTQESMKFDEPAIWSLARSANGSMRDALSLTDQAIAFGLGDISASAVSTMLGSIDQQTVYNLMQGLIDYDAQALMSEVARFSEHAPDYTAVLDDLLMLIHRLTLAQVSAECIDNSEGDREKVLALAAQLSAEELQLFYQMAILGKRDLGLAPDFRTGFEMTLIRLLTFKPAGVKEPIDRVLPQPVASSTVSAAPQEAVAVEDKPPVVADDAVEVSTVKKPEQGKSPVSDVKESSNVASNSESCAPPVDKAEDEVLVTADTDEPVEEVDVPVAAAPEIIPVQVSVDTVALEREAATASADVSPVVETTKVVEEIAITEDAECSADKHTMSFPESHAQWLENFHALPLQGLLKSIAAECVLQQVAQLDGELVVTLLLNLSQAQLFNERQQASIAQSLQGLTPLTLRVVIQALENEEFIQLSAGLLTMSQHESRLRQLDQVRAESHIAKDAVLASVIEAFDAQIIEGSIKPIVEA